MLVQYVNANVNACMHTDAVYTFVINKINNVDNKKMKRAGEKEQLM